MGCYSSSEQAHSNPSIMTPSRARVPANPAVLGLIGNTPPIEVTRLDRRPCRLFVKLENQNPGGSIKDLIALTMIEAAEQDGRLKAGGTVVEATTAIPVSVLCRPRAPRASACCGAASGGRRGRR